MTTDLDPLSQHQVESEILRLSSRLSEQTASIYSSARQAAQRSVDYKLAHAKALLAQVGHDGTVGEKEARATLDCADQLAAKEIEEAVFKADQEAGRNYRTQLEALRTIAANQRAAMDYSRGVGA